MRIREAFVVSCIVGFAGAAQAAPLGGTSGYTLYASTADPAGGFEYVRLIPDSVVLGHLDHALLSGLFYREDYSKEYALDDTATLVTVDTSSGAVTTIGPTQIHEWTHLSITANPSTGLGYVLVAENPCPGTDFYAIDLVTGITTLIGLVDGCLEGGMVAPDGTFFAIDSATSSLVDVRDGTIGALGFSVGDDATLYRVPGQTTTYLIATDVSTDTANVYTVDTVTGTATLIAPVSGMPGSFTGVAAGGPLPDDMFGNGFDG